MKQHRSFSSSLVSGDFFSTVYSSALTGAVAVAMLSHTLTVGKSSLNNGGGPKDFPLWYCVITIYFRMFIRFRGRRIEGKSGFGGDFPLI